MKETIALIIMITFVVGMVVAMLRFVFAGIRNRAFDAQGKWGLPCLVHFVVMGTYTLGDRSGLIIQREERSAFSQNIFRFFAVEDLKVGDRFEIIRGSEGPIIRMLMLTKEEADPFVDGFMTRELA